MTVQPIQTAEAPQAIGPYSQAMRAGDFVYLSGQIPLSPNGELRNGSVREEIEQIFANIKAVCSASGGSLQQIVKLNAYLTDLSDFPLFNECMEQVFSPPYPARAAVQVSALPKGVRVEVEGILYLG